MPETLRELPWVTEALCLRSAGQWTLLFNRTVLVRWAEAEGARIERAIAALLESLDSEQVVVVAYGQDEAAVTALSRRSSRSAAVVSGGLSEALLLAEPPRGPDLRQGEFAPQLPPALVGRLAAGCDRLAWH